MKNLLIILSFITCSLLSFAQVTPGIYGITRRANPLEVFFSKIDPATSIVTTLSNTSIAPTIVNIDRTIDPLKKIYYFIAPDTGGKYAFLGIDMKTGNILSKAITGNFTYFNNPVYNVSDSSIYGTARNTNPVSETFLGKIDPATGTVTKISTTSFGSGYVLIGNVIDPFKKRYYLEVQTSNGFKLLGIDLATGNIIDSPTITNTHGTYFTQLAFNYKDSCIYGLVKDNGNVPSYIAKINTNTGVVTNLSTTPVANTTVLTGATIDSSTNTFYLMGTATGGYSFIGVDLSSGSVVTNNTIVADSNRTFLLFTYYGADTSHPDTTTPISVKYNYLDPLSIYPNPANNTVYIKAPLKADYNVELINPAGQIVYSDKMKNTDNITINIAAYAKGNYFIRLRNDKASYLKKLTITD